MSGSSAPEIGTAEGIVRWAILGVGAAGRARARAIQGDPRSALVAVHRGRYARQLAVAYLERQEDAIAAADAVAICSPDAAHADQVEAALAAGRHAVVEYPLAQDPERARQLFAMAHEGGRVLHVEHIELLGAAAGALRRRVRRDRVSRVSVSFQGPGPPDVPGATLALRNLARLHRVIDVVGPFARVDAVEAAPGALRARLRSTNGVPVEAGFRLGPGLERQTRLVIEDGGTWEQVNRTLLRNGRPVTLPVTPSLFAMDHQVVVDRILEGGEPYMSEARVIHALAVAAQLRDGELGHLPFIVR